MPPRQNSRGGARPRWREILRRFHCSRRLAHTMPAVARWGPRDIEIASAPGRSSLLAGRSWLQCRRGQLLLGGRIESAFRLQQTELQASLVHWWKSSSLEKNLIRRRVHDDLLREGL